MNSRNRLELQRLRISVTEYQHAQSPSFTVDGHCKSRVGKQQKRLTQQTEQRQRFDSEMRRHAHERTSSRSLRSIGWILRMCAYVGVRLATAMRGRRCRACCYGVPECRLVVMETNKLRPHAAMAIGLLITQLREWHWPALVACQLLRSVCYRLISDKKCRFRKKSSTCASVA